MFKTQVRYFLTMFPIAIFVSTVNAEVPAAADEPKSPWTNESQLGVIVTSGNSDTESYSGKQATSYTRKLDTAKINASYLKTKAENPTTGTTNETARKWDAGTRYERAINDRWSVFVGYLLESDKYAGFDQRNNTDVGGKYIIVKKESYDALSEAGYRYVHQNNTDGTQTHYHSARLYLEGNYRLNATNSSKLWVEYLPNFNESKDYQTSAEASLASAISSIFSLKVAYLFKQDNKPEAGKEDYDRTFTTALVAKF